MFAALLNQSEPSWPLRGEVDWSAESVAPKPGAPYGRRTLFASNAGEVLLLQWAPGLATAPHDHGGASGWVRVLVGRLEEQRYLWRDGRLTPGGWFARATGSLSCVGPSDIHAMRQPALDLVPTLSLHVYQPLPPRGMRLYPEHGTALEVGPGCGAWWPAC